MFEDRGEVDFKYHMGVDKNVFLARPQRLKSESLSKEATVNRVNLHRTLKAKESAALVPTALAVIECTIFEAMLVL